MLFLEENIPVMCENLMPIIRLVRDGLIPLIQIGVPIMLIILGTIDLGKAVIASKEDEIKNAQKMLVKRAIYAVAIFFVVTIVSLVFSLFASTGDDDLEGDSTNWSYCWFEKWKDQ